MLVLPLLVKAVAHEKTRDIFTIPTLPHVSASSKADVDGTKKSDRTISMCIGVDYCELLLCRREESIRAGNY